MFLFLQYDKEALDPRGRTPLHLAVTLKHSECAEVLLYHGANALEVNRHQWSGRCGGRCGHYTPPSIHSLIYYQTINLFIHPY